MRVTHPHFLRCEESGEHPQHQKWKSGSLLLLPPPGGDLGAVLGTLTSPSQQRRSKYIHETGRAF